MEEERKESQKKEVNQELTESPKFDFMREQIKERPLNKKKLLRRTVLTAAMAVLFGLVACLTVLVLEPVFSNWLYPEEPAENIELPPETEEILPEDMVLDDEELEQEKEREEEPERTEAETETAQAQADMREQIDELALYRGIYSRLQDLGAEVSHALVTVTVVTSDRDWFDNMYESRGQTTGVIVANNNREYLILANAEPFKGEEAIHVTFYDGSQAQAEVKMTNPTVGLAALAVDNKAVKETTAEGIRPAKLGSSNYSSLTGSPVIALGSPSGVSGSVIYGVATSSGNLLHTVDSKYKLITTDICGSSDATGVLVNLEGEVIGIIDQSYNDAQMKNVISALGISELRGTIENLSNAVSEAYLGIYGTDVTQEANETLQVPYGAYVTEIEMDSPAMLVGIQSGDVIVSLNGRMVGNYEEYIEALRNSTPGSTVNVTVMRQNQEEYKAMSFPVELGELN